MKTNNSILKAAFLLIAVFMFGFANAQSCCQKKLADCPIVQNCSKKGQADCPLVKSENTTAAKELATCPLAGTPECPLVKNCAKKGTADCPYASANKTSATASVAKEGDVPPCCKRKK